MIKAFIYINLAFILSCNVFDEQIAPLEGKFYIQDGWLAFSSQLYNESIKHFNTAIETNEFGSLYHILSSIGKGWSFMYEAKSSISNDSVTNALLDSSSSNFVFAMDLYLSNNNIFEFQDDLLNLYTGLMLQNSFSAKYKSTIKTYQVDINLNKEIDSLYKQSIIFASKIDRPFNFQYDDKINDDKISLINIENYIMVGELDSAIYYYLQDGFECDGMEINHNSIISCLCIDMNDGACPFE
tara:strand:+ start:166 stop:888 length:723 start_codon:yes stop_codon:yes gene_type:complete